MNEFIRSAQICAHPAKDMFAGTEFESYPHEMAVKDAAQKLQMAALAFLGLAVGQVDNFTLLD